MYQFLLKDSYEMACSDKQVTGDSNPNPNFDQILSLKNRIRSERLAATYFFRLGVWVKSGMRIRHFFPRIRIRLSWKDIPDQTPDPT